MEKSLFRKRKGFTLVELLIALPLVLLIVGGAVDVLSRCLAASERIYLYVAHPGWQSAERLFAFLDIHLRHCGVGLPSDWEARLFSEQTVVGYMPEWSLWKKPVDVGETNEGTDFSSTGSSPGGALRLVSAVPTDSVLLRAFSSEGGRERAFFSAPVKSETTNSPASTASWIVTPGGHVPLRMTADVDSASPVLLAREAVALPAGTRICRLAALTMWARNGVVFADFHDDSGAQPLFRHIDELAFTLDTVRSLLKVKAVCAAGSSNPFELERSWRIVR